MVFVLSRNLFFFFLSEASVYLKGEGGEDGGGESPGAGWGWGRGRGKDRDREEEPERKAVIKFF